MKFVKPSTVTAKKAKNQLNNQSKFKSKETTDNKLQKNVKTVSNMSKKKSLDTLMGDVVKVKKGKGVNKGPASVNDGKKNGDVKLSPEIQLGLKLDRMLDKKSKKKATSDTTPVKSVEKKIKQGKTNIEPSDMSNKLSPSAKRKRRRIKLKNNTTDSENVNKPVDSVTNKNAPQGGKSGFVLKNKMAIKKTKQEETVSSEEDSSDDEAPVKMPKSEGVSNNDINMEDFTLNEPEVLKAVDSLLKLHSKKSQSSKKLMEDVPQTVFASFTIYVPSPSKRSMRFTLKNSLATSLSDVCLFVSDVCKKNIEESKEKWLDILKQENVTNVTEVIPLRSLMTEYTQFEDQRKLSCRFDFFLAEGKINKRVNGLLTQKFFHFVRKTPTPVILKAGDIANKINHALSKTNTFCKAASIKFSVEVGHTGMTSKEILENILSLWDQFPAQTGSYWENIREFDIFINDITPLPVFYNVQPPKGPLRKYGNMKWKKGKKDEPVEGELSTQLNKNVIVYPSGKVEIKRQVNGNPDKKKKKRTRANKKKSESSKSKVEEDEGSDDDLGGRADMLSNDSDDEEEQLEFESDSEPENVWALPKVNQKTKKGNKEVVQVKGNKKQKVADQEEDDDDDGIVDRAEEMYLQDLAEEKKSVKEDKKANKKSEVKGGKKTAVSVPAEVDDSEPSDEDLKESEEEVKVVKAKGKTNPSANQLPKGKQMPIPGKGGKKFTKNPVSGQNKNGVNKPGASKSPNQKFNSKKKQSPQKGNNKSNTENFQGIKADRKTKHKKNKAPVKNKVIAKKLAN